MGQNENGGDVVPLSWFDGGLIFRGIPRKQDIFNYMERERQDENESAVCENHVTGFTFTPEVDHYTVYGADTL